MGGLTKMRKKLNFHSGFYLSDGTVVCICILPLYFFDRLKVLTSETESFQAFATLIMRKLKIKTRVYDTPFKME